MRACGGISKPRNSSNPRRPVAESGEASSAVTADPALLGTVLFGELGLVLGALGLLFTALVVGGLALVLGRSVE